MSSSSVVGSVGWLPRRRSKARRCVSRSWIARTITSSQPLLYQVATAALSPADIAAPIRSVLRDQRNAAVLLGDVTGVDLVNRAVILAPDAETGETADDRLSYDFLNLASGAMTAYFGHNAWVQNAPGLKSLDDAIEIRRRVFLAFEAAERERDPATRQRLLTFVVVGGGPTGVELAGALAEIAHEVLDREFRAINPDDATIYLLDAGPRILPTFPERLSHTAAKDLESLGVIIRTKAAVTGIERDAVHLGDERVDTATVIWAAGVTASPLGKSLGVPLEKGGRVPVEPDLTLREHPDVFVIGDLAALNDQRGNLLPGLAPVATQQGERAAANILSTMRGESRVVFRYRDRGNIATIGRNRAVAVIYGIRTSGFIAWVLWVFIHILTLIGYRNRFAVMAQWTYAYLTHRRPARLIRAEKRYPRPLRVMKCDRITLHEGGMMDWRDYIHTDPKILVGKPVVKGTRLSVELILGLYAAGWTEEIILESYPTLTHEALLAVFAFAADWVHEHTQIAVPV